MATITQQQVNELMINAPPGVGPGDIIAGLKRKGHTVQGYEAVQKSMPVQIPTRQEETRKEIKGGLSKVPGLGFLAEPMIPLGESIGKAIFRLGAKLPEELGSVPGLGFVKDAQSLEDLKNTGKVSEDQYNNITRSAFTTKQQIASGAMTGLMAVPGVGGMLGKAGTQIAGKAPLIGTALRGAAGVAGAAAKIPGVKGLATAATYPARRLFGTPARRLFGGFEAAREFGEEGGPREIAGAAAKGAAFALVGGKVLGAAKGMPKTVSNFFFGPKGTTGIIARYRDPKGVETFLSTARRKPGGKNVEDVTTLLNKAVVSVRDKATKLFTAAEEKLVSKKLSKGEIYGRPQFIIKDFLGVEGKLTYNKISQSGLADTEANVIRKALRDIKVNKDFSTKGALKLRRTIDNLFRGTVATKRSDALIAKLRAHLNSLIEKGDPAFRAASKKYGEERAFLDRLGVNIIGKGKLNVDQTSNKLFQLAKDLDDPFRREASEALLLGLEQRTGVPFLKTLRALATAVNLSPQRSQGIRAGVIRELARVMEMGVSEVAGVAGRVREAIPGVPVKETMMRGVGLPGFKSIFRGRGVGPPTTSILKKKSLNR